MKEFLAIAIWNTPDGPFSISREVSDGIDSNDKDAIISFMGKEAAFSDEDNKEYLYEIILIREGPYGIPDAFKVFNCENIG